MNEEALFLSQVMLAVAVSLGVIRYLRGILRGTLLEICDRQPLRAEFWVRVLDVLMLIAPVILVMLFWKPGDAFVDVVRRTLLMVLIGQFISVALVARTLWNTMQAQWWRLAQAAPAQGGN